MKRVLVAFAAGLAVLLVMVSPAGASSPSTFDTSLSHGPNRGIVRATHRTIVVHDGECNGALLVARVDYKITGHADWRPLWDMNGCVLGDYAHTTDPGDYITEFRLCESPRYDTIHTSWCTVSIELP